MNRTKPIVYAVSAAAACAVVLGVAHGAGDSLWAALPGVLVAIYLAARGGSCSARRGSDR